MDTGYSLRLDNSKAYSLKETEDNEENASQHIHFRNVIVLNKRSLYPANVGI